MKKSFTARIFLFALLIGGLSTSPAFAQLGDAGEILRAGASDASQLLQEYLKPVGKGFGTDLNSGWFSTAATHRPLRFDVTVNASVARVPGADQLFNLNNMQFTDVECLSGCTDSPTIVGADHTGASIGSRTMIPGSNERLYQFDLPQGIGIPYIPAPMVQASVGLIKDTDVTLRFIPSMGFSDDVDLNLFGLGFKHGINQWLPGGNFLPVDLSVQAGFTNLSASVAFDVEPEVDSETENPFPASTWSGQKAEFKSSSYTVNALVGKRFPIISVFGGIGYQASTVEVGTPGAYPIVSVNPDYDSSAPSGPDNQPKIIEKIDDPVAIKYSDNSSFHAVVGTRLRLLILNISASYTISKYPVGQVGVGIGF